MSQQPSKLVAARITNWAYAIGGEHFSAQVKGFRHSISYPGTVEFHAWDVEHELTAEEAGLLTRKERRRGSDFRYEAGDESNRFVTRAELLEFIKAEWRKHFPDALAIKLGDGSIVSPQPTLDGPAWFVKGTGTIMKAWDKNNGYEGDRKKADALFKRYRALVLKLGED